MAKIIEIKTPNCTRCKQFEPEYNKIKESHPDHIYEELTFGVNPAAMEYATKFGIKSAPTFIIEQESKDTIVVKQEELAETINSLS